MILYPAIDIRGGQAVRLLQGDYERETTYDADPVDAAKRWAGEGAEFLHVVDLDGAKAGALQNLEAVERIAAAAPRSTAANRFSKSATVTLTIVSSSGACTCINHCPHAAPSSRHLNKEHVVPRPRPRWVRPQFTLP